MFTAEYTRRNPALPMEATELKGKSRTKTSTNPENDEESLNITTPELAVERCGKTTVLGDLIGDVRGPEQRGVDCGCSRKQGCDGDQPESRLSQGRLGCDGQGGIPKSLQDVERHIGHDTARDQEVDHDHNCDAAVDRTWQLALRPGHVGCSIRDQAKALVANEEDACPGEDRQRTGPGGWRQANNPLPRERHEGCHDEDD